MVLTNILRYKQCHWLAHITLNPQTTWHLIFMISSDPPYHHQFLLNDLLTICHSTCIYTTLGWFESLNILIIAIIIYKTIQLCISRDTKVKCTPLSLVFIRWLYSPCVFFWGKYNDITKYVLYGYLS